jgi:hypothetical protein
MTETLTEPTNIEQDHPSLWVDEYVNNASEWSEDKLNRVPSIAEAQPEQVERLKGVLDESLALGGSREEIIRRLTGYNEKLRFNNVMHREFKNLRTSPFGEVEPEKPWDGFEFADAVYQVLNQRAGEIDQAGEAYDETVDDMLETGLSYRDVMGDRTVRADTVSPNADTYARELADLKTSGNWDKVEAAADDVRERFEIVRSQLPDGVELSPIADSRSWILWDIGKQEHLKDKREGEGYTVWNTGSLLEGSEWADNMRNVTADRHLGWELYKQVTGGVDGSWIHTLPLEARERAFLNEVLSGKHQKKDGELPSHVYARLGEVIRRALAPPQVPDAESVETRGY